MACGRASTYQEQARSCSSPPQLVHAAVPDSLHVCFTDWICRNPEQSWFLTGRQVQVQVNKSREPYTLHQVYNSATPYPT